MRSPEGGGGIFLAAGQDSGRWRFSVAHELGHYHIPTHAQTGNTLSCADADLRARDSDRKTMEWEANDFAAELLMPRTLFANDIAMRDVSFHTTEWLASKEMYDVSRTAAAWRLIQTTRDAAALIVSVDGRVQWSARSDAFRFALPSHHQSIDARTIAASVVRGEATNAKPESVDPYAWLGSTYDQNIDVTESTLVVNSLRQVLSLVWVLPKG